VFQELSIHIRFILIESNDSAGIGLQQLWRQQVHHWAVNSLEADEWCDPSADESTHQNRSSMQMSNAQF